MKSPSTTPLLPKKSDQSDTQIQGSSTSVKGTYVPPVLPIKSLSGATKALYAGEFKEEESLFPTENQPNTTPSKRKSF